MHLFALHFAKPGLALCSVKLVKPQIFIENPNPCTIAMSLD
jgi:hypothetical protein